MIDISRQTAKRSTLSVVIPTLNSAGTLEACLRSITCQEMPRDRYEIVLADAGSTDGTIAIARSCGVDRIVENPLKTGEAGKAAGIKAASGGLIALVDSDNILPDPGWLERMIAPFADPDIVASEPIEYTARPDDPALTRYFALLGMNDPVCWITLWTYGVETLKKMSGKCQTPENRDTWQSKHGGTT